MRRVPVEKKRPSRWPWLLGIVALAGLAWGITVLLRPPEEPQPPAVEAAASDTLPPAAIPSPPAGFSGGPQGLQALAPVDEEDVGQAVRARGEVVATGESRFWLLAGSEVLMVDSDSAVRKGDTVSIQGTLQPAEPGPTDLIASEVLARHPGFDRWTVVRAVKLVQVDPEPVPADTGTSSS